MLLAEQVRQTLKEVSLIDDGTDYSRSDATWGTLHNYGDIGLSEAGLVVWRMLLDPAAGLTQYRLKIGSYGVWGAALYGADVYVSGIAWIASGNHPVILESKQADTHGVLDFKLGKAKLSDSVGHALAVYASEITKQVTSRIMAVGTLNQAMFAVICFAYTPGAQTNFENVGDSLTNGVSLEVDNSQVDWTTRNQDTGAHGNASATYYGAYSVGENHGFEIIKDNANTVVHICIIGCPWLLVSGIEKPVNLDFPQGSTLYVVLEPLNEDPTKYIKIGKKRSVSFGDTSDYNLNESGTGILPKSFTFDTIEVEESELWVSGDGGCVSFIGVDIK